MKITTNYEDFKIQLDFSEDVLDTTNKSFNEMICKIIFNKESFIYYLGTTKEREINSILSNLLNNENFSLSASLSGLKSTITIDYNNNSIDIFVFNEQGCKMSDLENYINNIFN